MAQGLPFQSLQKAQLQGGYLPRYRDFEKQASAAPPEIITRDDLIISPAAKRLRTIEQYLGQNLDNLPISTNMASRLTKIFHERWNRRRVLEYEWLDAYQRWNGQYSSDVMARMDPRKCRLWVNLTTMKCNSAHSSIMDFLRGNGDEQPWELKAPDIPEGFPIPPELQAKGMTIQTLRESLRKRTENMKWEIHWQLEDGDWEEELDKMVLDMVITGSGGFKGPFTVADGSVHWELKIGDGSILPEQVQGNNFKPGFRYAPVTNLYPDMECSNVQKSKGCFEEVLLTRRGMMDLAMQPGVNPAAVLKVLHERRNGDADILPHQIYLRSITGDVTPQQTDRWKIRIWAGEVSGEELASAGAEIPREMWDLATSGVVLFSGDTVISARHFEGPIPYYIVPYSKRGGDMPFGRGVPMLGKSSQDAINSAVRALLDNAAIASGPIIEVNEDLLELQPGEDAADIHAWKVYVSSHDGASGKRAINIHDIPANSGLFIQIIDLFRRFMDEETFIPSLTGGMQGMGTTRTATGMSILNTNANKTLKKVMRYIDDRFIEPFVEAMMDWNLRYNPKPHVMAVGRVMAKGSASLMAKEILTQRLMTVFQMAMGHPDHKDTALLRAIYQALGFPTDEFVLTDEEKAVVQQDIAQQGMVAPTGPGQGVNNPMNPGTGGGGGIPGGGGGGGGGQRAVAPMNAPPVQGDQLGGAQPSMNAPA